MRLILIRHGKPDTSDGSNRSNPPLSKTGETQAQAVADFLSDEHIDRILSSGMKRADSTAAPLAIRKNIEVEIIQPLGEIDRYGGKYANIETIQAAGEVEWQRFLADPLGYFGIDEKRFVGETLDGFQSIFETSHRGTVAVFTHGFPINILLAKALELKSVASFVPACGSISRLSGSALDKLTVVSVNETGHLKDDAS